MEDSYKIKHQYALIGNGRTARNIAHYFQFLGIPFSHWYRQLDKAALQVSLQNATCVLILVSDAAIEPFIRNNAVILQDKVLVHFSGSLFTSLAYGIHPLTSFSFELNTLDVYRKIPFVCEEGSPPFADLFPCLSNSNYILKKELKPFYHALCVLSGNFTTLLWRKLIQELENKCDLPKSISFPYMEQILNNLKKSPETALTGPFSRGDADTVVDNLAALQDDDFQPIYKAFVETFFENPESVL